MEPILETRALSHVYSVGTPFEHIALNQVDFRAYPGEILGIIGHTGSGKSTLIQHLNGLLRPTSGQVCFAGRDIWAEPKKIRDVRFQVGLVFQYPEYQLFEETVYKDIAFGPTNMKLSAREIDERVRASAALVGLGDEVLEQSPFELSGGQKRRVAIAGVVAMDPKVLILDEPTAGLDPRGRDAILEEISQINRQRGTTIILVSHSMDEIARVVDRLYVVNDGTLPFEGTPGEVFLHGEALSAMGLNIPQVTQVAQALNRLGVPVNPAVYTMEDAVRAILALRGKGGAASC
ncbi:MAG: energy-coupling factor transporter ATPase [Oscillospiraceae bacterium]|nr:energy-coupling factor transporter ATPase [Oscillospiraceae bacterium]